MSIEWEIKKKIKTQNDIIKTYSMQRYFNRSSYYNYDYLYDHFYEDILSHVSFMPDEIIHLIGTFLNPKEIIAIERINRIRNKQYHIWIFRI